MIDEIVERVGTLPHLPATIHRLISVVSDPGSSLNQIVETIRYDQILTTEVLRLCNSAYFGLARTVESLDDAVRMLGTVKILQLVMAAHARVILSRPQSGYGLPTGALWLHSVGVALGSQILAKHMRQSQVGLLFTAGLLHDVGKVALNEHVAREYAEIAQRVFSERISFCEAERDVLGFTHPEVGARLAETWNLPESIIRCIRYHHDPEALPDADPFVDAVHLADSVCLVMGVGGGDDGLAYRSSAAVMVRHNMTQSELDLLGADLIAELRSVQALFAEQV
jgi:putative nucleotidyltransferase with HDIG domain